MRYQNLADATDTGLKEGRLVWDQDTGRFDSYVSDAKGLTASHRRGNSLLDANSPTTRLCASIPWWGRTGVEEFGRPHGAHNAKIAGSNPAPGTMLDSTT